MSNSYYVTKIALFLVWPNPAAIM